MASDSDEEKSAKRSVHCRSQESNKEFKSRKHVLESLHKPGIVLLAPTKPSSVGIALHALPACAMRGARHHTHAIPSYKLKSDNRSAM